MQAGRCKDQEGTGVITEVEVGRVTNQPRGLAYYGGKSPLNGLCKWIVGILGWEKRSSYIEPFCGMMGVLLARQRVNVEMVNDLDGNLINWWRCVRENTPEMARQVYMTPRSRVVYSEAHELLNSGKGTDIERAVAFQVILEQGLMHGPDVHGLKSGWRQIYSPDCGGAYSRWTGAEFGVLADRLRNIQIENRCALEILDRAAKQDRCTVYCDPPYRTADRSPYAHSVVDYESMTEILLRQKGRLAVSGYYDDWDHLGWFRHEYQTKFCHSGANAHRPAEKRTEVLWTNFPSNQMRLFDA